MARYLDTGSGGPQHYLGHWLDENVTLTLRGFRCQFGYFRYRAIAPFADTLRARAQAGDPVHLVLGSNGGSLIAEDVQCALRIIDGEAARLTIVAFSGAEFHPKVVHITRVDGSVAALVGSSNLTENGLGTNVEASVVLDSREGDAPGTFGEIAGAIDRWHGLSADGVFHVETDADVQGLVDAGIINLPQLLKPPMSRPRAHGRRRTALGRRVRAWTAHGRFARPALPAVIAPPPARIAPVAAPAHVPTVAVPAGAGTVIAAQWCKELRSSDAQQVRPGTNPTGKLRLTESRFPIDHRTWFRNGLFGPATWVSEIVHGQGYEVATITFETKVRGRSWGPRVLTVDHAPHRVAGQGNVPTVLSWGRDLGRELQRVNHVGSWVVITRDVNGRFALTIQRSHPAWAP